MAYHPFPESEMLTATAMGHFQSELDSALVLSLFVPLIISSGGNSAPAAATYHSCDGFERTYSEALVVCHEREIFSGLTLGSSWERSVDQNYDLAGISLGKL
jgi:magnesium transporter